MVGKSFELQAYRSPDNILGTDQKKELHRLGATSQTLTHPQRTGPDLTRPPDRTYRADCAGLDSQRDEEGPSGSLGPTAIEAADQTWATSHLGQACDESRGLGGKLATGSKLVATYCVENTVFFMF